MFSEGHVRKGETTRITGLKNGGLSDYLTSIMPIKIICQYISDCNTDKFIRNVEFFN
jgi:hypothetical protein